MQNFLEQFIRHMRPVFSRRASFAWFVVVFIGMLTRTDALGVSSVVRALSLTPGCYPLLLHFFHSSSWNVQAMRQRWTLFLLRHADLFRIAGRFVMLGDDTKTPKGARKMPAVHTMRQHSETSSKPAHFRGHEWGANCVLTCGGRFATPVWFGLYQPHHYATRISDMLNQAVEFAKMAGQQTLLVLDAGFVAGEVLRLGTLTGGLVHTLVRAKKNCTAFLPPKQAEKGKRGRPKKYGKAVKVRDLFTKKKKLFQKAKTVLYGKEETVTLLAMDLLWKPAACIVRFVLANTPRGQIVLMCSDTTLAPADILRAYSCRAKIETFFDTLKNLLGGLQYHFWSASLAAISRRPEKNAVPASLPASAQVTAEAIEKFACLQAMVVGILQLLAAKYGTEIHATARCWLRTPSRAVPSEFIARIACGNLFRQFLQGSGGGWIMEIIRAKQKNIPADAAHTQAA